MKDTATQPRSFAQPQEDLPGISVVIIGRNEGPRLVRCLESILDVDYPKGRVELIYVDTDSSDDSCARAEGLGATVIRIKPERPSAALARNAGLEKTRYTLVQFLDGDTILDPAWLRKGVQALTDPNVACVFGRRDEISPNATVYNFWAHCDWHTPPGPADSCGGDALFRRSVMEHVGGFDKSLIAGEEPDLCFRIRRELGMIILSLAAPMTRHDMNMTRFSQYWRRCKRTGHAYAEVARRYPEMRRWRIARWRNLAYTLAFPSAIGLSVGIPSLWPMAVWGAALTIALFRNAARLHRQLGGWRGAFLCSLHHYLCKAPMAVGQCGYWFRSLFRRAPQPLLEYRQ